MNELAAFNQRIIDEFRANGGVVGGPFQGAQLLLLGTTGAKSGAARLNPLAYLEDADRIIVIASFAGADSHPPWFFNLLTNPRVTVELGSETFQAEASVVHEPERSRLYDKMANRMPTFEEYRNKTARVIPVVALARA
jgi:deazaflavin-dependent oxidoreductase (nitroreductase family)